MSRTISYFSDYHGKENRATNYCGLMLKMIYEESPTAFENIVANILADKGVSITIGPRFYQQQKKVDSIPDLCITQQSLNIFFETKTSDWFYSDQLNRHIKGFEGNNAINILILLSNFEQTFSSIDDQIIEVERNNPNIYIVKMTFEDLLGFMENVCKSDFLIQQLNEFRSYLDKENLLPTWKYRLDVVNCAGKPIEVEEDRVYICPDNETAYTHKRALYFGAYKDKRVHHIYTIDAVVSISENGETATIKWINRPTENCEKNLCKKAKDVIKKYRIEENKIKPLQVFILSDERCVNFVKETKGGMFGSKTYFEFKASECQTIDKLADRINDKNWGDFVN
jgi:hypothetical protein